MKYLIDTEAGTCIPYESAQGFVDNSVNPGEKCVDMLLQHVGEKEYAGFVAEIQKWYYGWVVEAAWCATTVSYCLSHAGIPIKEENVWRLLNTMEDRLKLHGRMYFRQDFTNLKLNRGDVLFWNWDAPKALTATSSKHVNFVESVNSEHTVVKAIGGNQDDQIKISEYRLGESLYAVFKWT